MVAGVGVSKGGKLAAGLPVELAGIDDDTAQRGAVAADELGGRVDNDVRAVLDRTDQVRSAEGVVDDQRDVVLVGNLGDGVDVGNVRVGVTQRLQIYLSLVGTQWSISPYPIKVGTEFASTKYVGETE